MNKTPPLQVAICGIGGFASSHHREFALLEKNGRVRVVATCDPALELIPETCLAHNFAVRGVSTHHSFGEMIESAAPDLDLGVVATPIHCHAPMHGELVRRGIACYLEKPPTLDPLELDRMLEAEKAARIPTHVGFCYIFLADRIALKERIVAGEFGRALEFSFLGLAPRTPAYFQRSDWAGRLRLGDTLVLDSCLGNAMAHHLNNMLFWAGTESVSTRARPLEMESELYRANPIEGCDTIFANCRLNNGTTLRLAASHAVDKAENATVERMVFEYATVAIENGTKTTIAWRDNLKETIELQPPSLAASLVSYLDFLEGRAGRPPQTLEESRGFVEANALFYSAAKAIHTIDGVHIRQESPGAARAIAGIGEACRRMAENGMPPSRSSVAWGRPGGTATVAETVQLRQTVDHLVANFNASVGN